MRRIILALAGLALLLSSCGEPATKLDSQPVDRVLVVSLPGVGWADLGRHELPNLEAFVEDAAIGDISTRIGRRNAGLTDAYLTIGAGTRAEAPGVDMAVALDSDDPDDLYGGVPTADVLARRLGYEPPGIAYLASGAARDVNDSSAFGAEVGLLGQELDEAGVARAVIANADAVEGFVDDERPPDGYYARSAATALMGPDGIVPEGKVSRSLLVDDADAAFGRRLDQGKVMAAFDEVWTAGNERQVVLVEASDIARAEAYRPLATASQRRALRTEALIQADEMLGRLLAEVDPERDAVMVLSPISPSGSPDLAIAALSGPNMDPGYLQSSTTRRDGYVHLADVAPTIMTLLGEEFPSDAEGRSFQVSSSTPGDRIDYLVDSADAAAFRDGFLPVAVTLIVVIIALLALATALRDHLPGWVRAAVAPLAFGVLGTVPGTFLTGSVGLAHDSMLGHIVVIVAVAGLVAGVATAIERRRRGLGVILAVGATVALISVDVVVGTPLQMNTIFGYSVAVAGRFTGLGNLAYALLGSAAVLLAALVVERYGDRVLGVVLAMLGVVAVVDGLPMLGADVGGVVSLIPAFGVTLLILAGRRIDVRTALWLAGATAVVVLTFAFIDAARPDQSHTHLARLAKLVLDGRWDQMLTIVNRRWQASFGSLDLAGWGTVVTLLAAAWVYAEIQARRQRGQPILPAGLARPAARHNPTLAALAGLIVLGVVGLVANDSSLAVPLTMLIVAMPVFVVRTMTDQQPAIEVAQATAQTTEATSAGLRRSP